MLLNFLNEILEMVYFRTQIDFKIELNDYQIQAITLKMFKTFNLNDLHIVGKQNIYVILLE